MAGTTLGLLPPELLASVADNLTTRDTAALSATSKSLSVALQSSLYSSIDMEWTYQTYPPLSQLLRTLLEKPRLAHYISTISLTGVGFGPDYSKSSTIPPDLPKHVALPADVLHKVIHATGVADDDADLWLDATLRVGADAIAAWDTEIWESEAAHLDAVVALLVTISPNLACLSLSPNWVNSSSYLGALARARIANRSNARVQCVSDNHDAVSVSSFHCLHEVTIAGGLRTTEMLRLENTIDALSWFYLPAVKRLSVSIDNPNTFAWTMADTAQSTTLTSLEVHRLREPWLRSLLAPLTNLANLRFNWFCQKDIKQCGTVADLDQLAASVSESCPQLETLEITASALPAASYGEYESPEVYIKGCLGSLSRLKKLRQLSVPWVFAVGTVQPEDNEASSRLCSMLSPALQRLELNLDLSSQWNNGWEDADVNRTIYDAFSTLGTARLENLATIILPQSTDSASAELKASATSSWTTSCNLINRLSAEYHIEIARQPKPLLYV